MTKAIQPSSSDPKGNRLLAAFSPTDYQALLPYMHVTNLKMRSHLYHQNQRVDSIYFPLDCLVSVLVGVEPKSLVEMGIVGNDGAAGVSALLEVDEAVGLNLVQIPGLAVRIDAKRFKEETQRRPALDGLMRRYAYVVLRELLFVAACNQLHTMEERCARWLLMTHDRIGRDTFPMTQEFLSNMIGVRRATVNLAMGALTKAGFILHARGKVTIVDRPGLVSVSCTCYQSIKAAYHYVSKKV
jgi:CRP-like cAMP-binding protein